MKLLDVIKRAILEGKLDTELGITDCDVMQRFDKVMELLDKPIKLPRFELPAINKPNDNFYKDYHEKFGHKITPEPIPFDYSKSNVNPNPFDWRNKVWCSSNPIVMGNVRETEDEV